MVVPKIKDPQLKVICEPLGIVATVKNFSLAETQKIFEKLKTEFLRSGKIIRITDYARGVIRIFLDNPDSFFEFVKKDKHLNAIADEVKESDTFTIQTEILMSMYESITDLYTQFKIQNLCGTVNELFRKDKLDTESIVQDLVKDMWDRTDKKSGISEIKVDKVFIRDLQAFLRKEIIGQDHVIDKMIANVKLIASGLSQRFSMFFIGSTGCGKSLTVKRLGEAFGGRIIQVNCNEFSHGHEHNKLIGAPPGYVGHAEKSYLKEKAEKSNQWVFLFDEIEKANAKFFDFLLTLMDEGRITDNHGANLDFTKSIIIFTSNQGMDEINVNPISFSKLAGASNIIDSESQVRASMKKKFRPEFLNRIDEIVFFNNLTRDNLEKIARDNLGKYNIVGTDDLVEFVLNGGYSVEYGAREINRFIKNNVLNVLSEEIMTLGKFSKTTYYIPKFVEGKLTFSMG